MPRPALPPEDTPGRSVVWKRACAGLLEGASWGSAIGAGRGIVEAFRGTTTWYIVIGSSLLAGTVIGSVVCGIGRTLSGRLAGAWLGAAVGILLGLLLGHALGGYQWTTTTNLDGSVTAVGTPVGQIIGSAIGWVLGAAVGALIDRGVRGEVMSD